VFSKISFSVKAVKYTLRIAPYALHERRIELLRIANKEHYTLSSYMITMNIICNDLTCLMINNAEK